MLAFACLVLNLAGAQTAQAAHETGEFVKTATKGTTYTLHVPRSYDRQKGATLLFWLHGAGDNHKNVARAVLSHRYKPDWIFVFPDAASEGRWQDHEMDRVIDVLDEVCDAYSVRRAFIGGFSRGGFFTFQFGLNHADRFAGFLCVAGGLSAPGLVKKEDASRYAVAILHGDADTVVDPSYGTKAKEAFERAGWKDRLYFRSLPGLGHRPDRKAVGAALDWLDETAQPLETPDDYYAYGAKLYAEEKYGRALWAYRQAAGEENAKKKWYRNVQSALKKIEQKSEAAGKKVKKAIDADRNKKWLADWEAYDDQFAGTVFHQEVAAAFEQRFAAHNESADRLLAEAHSAAESQDIKAAIDACLEIRDRCFAVDGESVDGARELLEKFRADAAIARKYRRILKGTEDWR